MGTDADRKTLMLVLLDSNIIISALLSLNGIPAQTGLTFVRPFAFVS
jgi:hypothetical protein